MDGGNLYTVVAEYAALGDHRTGSIADRATIDWFADHLRRCGGSVSVLPFEFSRYDATWRVEIDGTEVESLPVFYSGVGSMRSAQPPTGSVQTIGPLAGRGLARLVQKARSRGHEVALATTGGSRLSGMNRPVAEPGPVAVLTIGPEHVDDVRDGDGRVEVAIDAACRPAASANVMATFGTATPTSPGLVLATPLSGWYACAGERGTGIAVLLGLIERIASMLPVTVVGTSGHELEGEGLRRLLGDSRPELAGSAAGIVHLGASIAARGPDDRLAPGLARHNSPTIADALAAMLTPLGRHVEQVPARRTTDRASWVGEAREWCAKGAPLLSLTGGFPLFHTSADRPAAATSPALLAEAADAIGRAVTAFAEAVRR